MTVVVTADTRPELMTLIEAELPTGEAWDPMARQVIRVRAISEPVITHVPSGRWWAEWEVG